MRETWLICGGREFRDAKMMFAALDDLTGHELLQPRRQYRIVHGDARGADTIADIWARVRDHDVQPYPADWDTHKRLAGSIRNAAMLEHENVVRVVAFPGNWGTRDMVSKALAAGIAVVEVNKKGGYVRK